MQACVSSGSEGTGRAGLPLALDCRQYELLRFLWGGELRTWFWGLHPAGVVFTWAHLSQPLENSIEWPPKGRVCHCERARGKYLSFLFCFCLSPCIYLFICFCLCFIPYLMVVKIHDPSPTVPGARKPWKPQKPGVTLHFIWPD